VTEFQHVFLAGNTTATVRYDSIGIGIGIPATATLKQHRAAGFNALSH
tara:strand:- start:348 stop:491 length:144 start_codon:yes stop_codon:yes gene_type:complete